MGFAYSKNGLSWRMWDDSASLAPGEVYFSTTPTTAELSAAFTGYTAAAAAAAAEQNAASLIEAGITITSTGTPSLDGAYAVDANSKSLIDGIYAGIKNGDGLPGGGATFNYPDANGAMHAFDATSFPNFAKAVRDYLYAISQGQTPASPVTIP